MENVVDKNEDYVERLSKYDDSIDEEIEEQKKDHWSHKDSLLKSHTRVSKIYRSKSGAKCTTTYSTLY